MAWWLVPIGWIVGCYLVVVWPVVRAWWTLSEGVAPKSHVDYGIPGEEAPPSESDCGYMTVLPDRIITRCGDEVRL